MIFAVNVSAGIKAGNVGFHALVGFMAPALKLDIKCSQDRSQRSLLAADGAEHLVCGNRCLFAVFGKGDLSAAPQR